MNTANKLTVLRVLLIPLFVMLLYVEMPVYIVIPILAAKISISTPIALFIFIIAALTDLADGYIARSRNQVTEFGIFMDPLADKILTFAAMIWFVEAALMPAWIVLIVIIREFMVTGIRLVASAKGTVIAASKLGKMKTLTTVNGIIAIFLIYMLIPDMKWSLYICWTLIAITTIVSGVEYYIKNKKIMNLDL